MIIAPSVLSDPLAFKKLIADRRIAFFDFGCSSGGSMRWLEEATGMVGLGFDVDAEKLDLAAQSGLLCSAQDILALPDTKLVDHTIIFHMLEHLEGVDQAATFIEKAVSVSRTSVVIQQPYYDADPQLFHRGFKTFYSHWTGHKNQMTTPDFYFILDKLRRRSRIKDFVIAYKTPILNSNSEVIHSLDSGVNCHEYSAALHPPKAIDVAFDFPLYDEIQVAIDIENDGSDVIWQHMKPDHVGFDSRHPLPAPVPALMPVASSGSAPAVPQLRKSRPSRPIKFFIRDENFTQWTPKFERLEGLAANHGDVMLAVIPGNMNITAAQAERVLKNFVPAQQGYRHKSHAPGDLRNEFPEERPRDLVEQDMLAGKAVMEQVFGAGAARHFVAPWNRFASKHFDLLKKHGFQTFHGVGVLDFHDGMPLIGYGINFTSLYQDAGADYNRMLAAAEDRIELHLAELQNRTRSEEFYFSIGTHHLMMNDEQFVFLERMINDLQQVHHYQFAAASEALRHFIGLTRHSV